MKKPIYKVGDKILIKNIKVADSDLYTFGINRDMERFANAVMTIIEVDSYNRTPEQVRYRMKEDGRTWSWSLSMFKSIKTSFIDLSLMV